MEIIDIHISLRDAVNDGITRAVAIAALTVIALIHVLESPDAFDEAGYLGALFIAAAVGCVLVATAMARSTDSRVWAAAGGLAGLILLGYVISRAVGLPGFTGDIGEWAEPRGMVAMVVESLTVVLSGAVLATRHPMTSQAAERRPAGHAPAHTA
jgi:hypothetical protein